MTVIFLSAAAFMAGCDKAQTLSQQLDKVQTETKQAAQDLKSHTFAQLKEVGGERRGFVYVLNSSHHPIEPAHWLCANGYEDKKKSILQSYGFDTWGIGDARRKL